jgi:hypothetical protein
MSKSKEKKVKDTTEPRVPSKAVPLLVFASVLSVASLSWTTYSLLDLLKVGWIGFTVAATADLIWSAVIWCEYKGIGGKKTVKSIGWVAVGIVGGFIAWHGATTGSVEMAVAGPFLTIGTKAIWELALIALKDEVTEKKEASAKEVALLNAETDTIMELAEAEIRRDEAESEAAHRKALAEKKRQHELKMAELIYAAEEKQAVSENRLELLASQMENTTLERILGAVEQRTIPGQVLPQPGQDRMLSAAPQAAGATPRTMLTLSLGQNDGQEDPLTEAQEARKRLAALFYLYEAEAATKNQKLTQTAYADLMGTNKVQVSRACREFPVESIKDIEAYREEMKATG